MEDCKKFYNNPEKYSLYVHGYFIPWLEEQRQKGLIYDGKQV